MTSVKGKDAAGENKPVQWNDVLADVRADIAHLAKLVPIMVR